MADPMFDQAVIDGYVEAGWWGTDPLAKIVAGHASTRPDAPAYVVISEGGDGVMTWSQYDHRSSELAGALVRAGLEPGTRVGVILPDGATVHTVFLAAEKAGLVLVGIGARAGDAEVRYLAGRTGATALLTLEQRGQQSWAESVAALRADGMPGLRHIVVSDVLANPSAPVLVSVDGAPVMAGDGFTELLDGRGLGPDDLFMLNSTSGTTGLPKCVMHTENRWLYFHKLAAEAGELTSDDVFFSALPAPFGFGLWTAHFTPAVLGCPTVVPERFQPDRSLRAMATYRVSVFACVSTQFIMMLNSPLIDEARPHRAPRHVHGR